MARTFDVVLKFHKIHNSWNSAAKLRTNLGFRRRPSSSRRSRIGRRAEGHLRGRSKRRPPSSAACPAHSDRSWKFEKGGLVNNNKLTMAQWQNSRFTPGRPRFESRHSLVRERRQSNQFKTECEKWNTNDTRNIFLAASWALIRAIPHQCTNNLTEWISARSITVSPA